ncbi:MAG: ABC transporter permease, partial [Gemmatimonadota bacterium]
MSAALLRIRRLVRKELRQLFRDPRTKRIIFASPIVQLLLFGYAVNTDVRGVPMFVQDFDRTAESRALVQAIAAGPELRVVGTSNHSADLTRALDHGDAVIGIVVPAGFEADLAAGRTAPVQVVVDGTNSTTGIVAQGYATQAIQAYGQRRAAERVGADPDPPIRLDARAWFNPGLASRVYNVPAVVGMIVMLMSMLLTGLSVVRERELGTLDQLLVSPLSPGELMLGKTIPVALIAMAQL